MAEWVLDQGQYLPSGLHAVVLMYLSLRAFYDPDNPEKAEVGQVMRQASKVESIMAGTAIKSRETVRKILNELQDMAFIQREERPKEPGIYGPRPHVIYVLWEMDGLRAEIRDGSKTLPPPLRIRPTAAPRKTKPQPIFEVVQMPVSINSEV